VTNDARCCSRTSLLFLAFHLCKRKRLNHSEPLKPRTLHSRPPGFCLTVIVCTPSWTHDIQRTPGSSLCLLRVATNLSSLSNHILDLAVGLSQSPCHLYFPKKINRRSNGLFQNPRTRSMPLQLRSYTSLTRIGQDGLILASKARLCWQTTLLGTLSG
jgi:hypothetical protein